VTLLQRLPLSFKMVVLTLVVGGSAWLVLDRIHTAELEQIFHQKLMAQLAHQARDDRRSFDHYLRSHNQAAKFIAAQSHMTAYLEKTAAQLWPALRTPYFYRGVTPPWFPRNSVSRIFASPRYALLVDNHDRVREVYEAGPHPLPKALLRPGPLLAKLSHVSSLMTDVDNRPFLLSTAALEAGGHRFGTLVLASPLDSEFLFQAERPDMDGHIILLLHGGRIIASNRPASVPPGTPVEKLAERYVITGKSFFDYGASDLTLEFGSAAPTAQVSALVRELLGKERSERLVSGAVLILAFLALILWVSNHIRNVTRQILAFSRDTLGAEPVSDIHGDELYALRTHFGRLQGEILRSRDALTAAVREKTRAELAAEQERDAVALLRSVTDALGVGVLYESAGRLEPRNGMMEDFLGAVPNAETFRLESEFDSIERALATRDDQVRWFDIRRAPPGDAGSLLLIRDITDERDTRRRLQLTVEVIENSSEGMFVAGDDGTIKLVNPAFCSLTGFTEAQVREQGVVFLSTLFNDSERRRRIWATLTHWGRWEGEFALEHGGETRQVWLRMNAVKGSAAQEVHYVGLLSDITERHRAQETLHRYADELRKSSEEARTFTYIVSHDLRAPLVNIKGFVHELGYTLNELREIITPPVAGLPDAARRRIDHAFSDEIPESLEFIDSSVKKMDSLIGAILNLSRLGRLELKPEPLDMTALVQESLSTQLYQLEQRRVRVVVGDLPDVVADRTAMEQIIGNILSNAVNYLDPERPGRIEISGEHGPTATTFHVADNGRGINSHERHKVFAIFRRGVNEEIPGEGMGMPYVQTLVRRHGGQIWFRTTPGHGTIFSFTVPHTAPEKLSENQSDAI